MNKVNIPFGGMTNVPDDSFSKDGDMSVLLNMRHKGGELVQCQPPTERPASKVMQAMFHAQSNQWLELTTEGILQYTDGSFPVTDIKSFAIMGNIVIMNLADRVEYAIWRNRYEYLGGLPEMPEIKISITSKIHHFLTDEEYGSDTVLWGNVSAGFFERCIYELNEEGYYIDRTLFRFALKLFDGNYIALSNIVYVSDDTPMDEVEKDNPNHTPDVGRDSSNLISEKQDNAAQTKYHVYARGFKPTFELDVSKLEKWKDVIIGIDIFSTPSIMGKKKSKNRNNFEAYQSKNIGELIKDIGDSGLFFLVATYDISGVLINRVDNVSTSNLAVQESLSDTSGSVPIFTDALSFNSRLHLPGVKEWIFNGYGLESYIPVFRDEDMVEIDEMAVQVKIKENGRDVTVNRIFKTPELGTNDGVFNFPAMLGFPNVNAYEMTIFIKAKDQKVYSKAFQLVAHKLLNYAYYINTVLPNVAIKTTYFFNNTSVQPNAELSAKDAIKLFGSAGTYKVVYNSSEGDWTYNGHVVSPAFKRHRTFTVPRDVTDGDWMQFEITGDSSAEDIANTIVDNSWVGGEMPAELQREFVDRTNILKVSAVDNPFYFPTAQTYKFEGDIVGLASNAEAISPGQFGAYPLFVFTTEGIWAMQTDTSGQGAYLSQSPFSREVCDGAICPVSGGVVFTTKRGLMAISGGQVVELSKPLDGLEEMLFNFSGPLAGRIFARAGYDGYEKFEPVPIREYIQGESGAKLAYNYLHNEVILSNPDEKYKYSYVYSLDSQTWGMIDTKFDITTNSYPELVVYNNNEMKQYTFDDTTTGVVPIVAITRPFTLGSLDFKRLRQAALRTTFDGQLNFYLLGSNDGASFVCITGKEVDAYILDSGTYRDLVTSMSRSKQYKYFAIAVVGNMSGRVSMAELLVDAGFAVNKLR